MLKHFGAVLFILFLSTNYCTAGFIVRFDSQNTVANVGSTVNVAVVLEETAGTNFFNDPLAGAAFSITNANPSIASIAAFAPNPNLNLSPSISVGPAGGSFTISAPIGGPGVTGAVRTLGTLSFNLNSVGTTNFQLGLAPDVADELLFGAFPSYQTVDLSSGTVPVTFQTGSITAVPEPSSMVLLGLLTVPAVAYRRWKKARA